jgi:hypothetical protein
MVNSRRMRWAGHIECIWGKLKLKGRDHPEDLGVDGR